MITINAMFSIGFCSSLVDLTLDKDSPSPPFCLSHAPREEKVNTMDKDKANC